jgi:hypothetical protein
MMSSQTIYLVRRASAIKIVRMPRAHYVVGIGPWFPRVSRPLFVTSAVKSYSNALPFR